MTRPNVVLILADDLGYSDLGCYGGEIRTPSLDGLAAQGVRLAQFYNTARCSPSRASLLTGLHPHQTGIGILTNDDGPRGYPGTLRADSATLAEVLGGAGYDTAMFGKWHLTSQIEEPDETWPTRRGFGSWFGTLAGCGSYYWPTTLHDGEEPVSELPRQDDDFYYTDEISRRACDYLDARDGETPFLMYVAYTAPHWPLHAREEDVAAYDGAYADGWDQLRERRLERLRGTGLLEEGTGLSERDPAQPPWTDAPDQEWQQRRMEVYAAQVEVMDRGIGRILERLEASGLADDTIVIFLADNGACAEELPFGDPETFAARRSIVPPSTRAGAPLAVGNYPHLLPGPEDTYASYGQAWANLSNTPFRLYKRWVHEGGIATPFVVRWPAGGLADGEVVRTPFQLTHVLPTLLEAADVTHPAAAGETRWQRPDAPSMLPAWRGGEVDPGTLCWEHLGNAAVRRGGWKLVREYPGPWELYDVGADRSETDDRAAQHPELVAELAAAYDAWAGRVGVVPRQQIIDLYDELFAQGAVVEGGVNG
ncbi:arylsulfatase [Nocardioides mangrovi]|uniref:Arylsulfatase n=1 Tax=Nocardioides mangrovi TaxID=2874580 RepID=A0ABS7UI48_9ACTN|nr:arylsulfatase [Nocardioides mangrovi]MBZ5740708.1 arylsulfatase [Nocardioides mangrovi]